MYGSLILQQSAFVVIFEPNEELIGPNLIENFFLSFIFTMYALANFFTSQYHSWPFPGNGGTYRCAAAAPHFGGVRYVPSQLGTIEILPLRGIAEIFAPSCHV